MNVIAPQISSRMFFYDPSLEMFTAEISWFGTPECGANPLGPFYRGSTEVRGFLMVSGRTGLVAGFQLANTVRDADNDIVFWELKPTYRTACEFPEMWNVTIRIFND